MIDGTWTLLSCQYLWFCARVYFCVENCETTYGPVPTGFGSAKAAGLEIFCQMCFGTIYIPAMRNKLAYSGCLKVSTAVVGFGAVALSGTGGGETGVSEALSFSRLKLNATSLAVIGLPSLNLTPLRIVSVRVLPPLDHW